jgi:6-phosphogluconolactonase/glucosamine-6-phosphate isomerase/deaminase
MKWRVNTAQEATAKITKYILDAAKTHKSILLLVSGGSAITAEADVLRDVDGITQILSVLPMDERYGPYGHDDSNMAQLGKRLKNGKATPFHDILEQNMSFDETVEHYSSLAQDLFALADHIVAIFGIGPDGHTIGLLPGSPATTDAVSTVIGYSWQDYTRMTLGVSSLLQVNTAFVLAFGDAKKQALNRLRSNNDSFAELPAKILYDIADVTIYNDFISSDEEGKE